jgi:CubicO group peptidase (beta-lactamase class C family)
VGLCCFGLSGCGIEGQSVERFLNDIGKVVSEQNVPDQMVSADSVENPLDRSEAADLAETDPIPEQGTSSESSGTGTDIVDGLGKEYLTGEWAIGQPGDHGMEQEWLDALCEELITGSVRAALLVKDGTIVYEYYGTGDNTETKYSLYSCTKSVTSAAVGLAIEQELLPGVNSKLADFFPDLADPEKEDITIAHLLNLTSGIEWKESVSSGILLEWMLADNQVDYVLNKKMVGQPGEAFNYNSGNTQLLAAILEKVTGQSEADYVRENILTPIGIGDVSWWEDAQGITFGGFGIWLTAREAARFGQLYLNEGRWGEQQIIPADWVKLSTVPQGPTDFYGYNWWIDVPEPDQQFRMYYASGFGGQHIIIVPEYQMVAVVMSMGVTDDSLVSTFKEHLMDW